MAGTRKLRFLKSRGYLGQIVRAGSVIDVSEFWASIFIADGTAIAAEEQPEEKPAEKIESVKPKKKGKK
jgi:hypothetical protein